MSKTPVPGSNPSITKSTNKKWFTPCRQIGLSRSRKTPNSIIKTTAPTLVTTPLTSATETSKNESKTSLDEPTKITLTPKDNKLETKSARRQLYDKNPSKEEVKDEKRTIKETSTLESDVVTKEQIPTIKEDTRTKMESVVKSKDSKSQSSKKRKLIDSGESKNAKRANLQNQTKGECDKDKKIADKNERSNLKSSQKELLVENPNKTKMTDETPSKEIITEAPIKIEGNSPVIKVSKENLSKKHIGKKLLQPEKAPVKKDIPVDPKPLKIQSIVDESKKPHNENIEVLPEKHGSLQEESLLRSPLRLIQTGTKLKRTLSLKKDKQPSTKKEPPSLVPYFTNNSSEKVTNVEEPPKLDPYFVDDLEKEVIKKRELLEQLKQVEIYANKHNIANLEEVTELWKKGCISGLQDMLPQLNKYVEDLNMHTLLNKLGVPPDLISISENGDLI